MKTLERLIGMSQINLDRARRTLTDLEAVHADLQQQLLRLDAQMADEMKAAGSDPLLTANIGTYVKLTREKQVRLRESMRALEPEIETAREAVNEAFRERKRFEHVLEQRRAERKLKQNRREQTKLDEMGLQLQRSRAAEGILESEFRPPRRQRR